MSWRDVLQSIEITFLPATAGSAAPVVTIAPSPAAGAAAYPCCDDCGAREPCDQYCPNFMHQMMQENGTSYPRGFDPKAFESEIEPVPAFLTRPADPQAEIEKLLELARAEEWPAPPRRMAG